MKKPRMTPMAADVRTGRVRIDPRVSASSAVFVVFQANSRSAIIPEDSKFQSLVVNFGALRVMPIHPDFSS
jgi:hypothetical protein